MCQKHVAQCPRPRTRPRSAFTTRHLVIFGRQNRVRCLGFVWVQAVFLQAQAVFLQVCLLDLCFIPLPLPLSPYPLLSPSSLSPIFFSPFPQWPKKDVKEAPGEPSAKRVLGTSRV